MTARRRIDQVLAGYAEGDAISHEARLLRDIFRALGHDSDIFADTACIAPSARDTCKPLSEMAAAQPSVLLHHYSIASPAVDEFMASSAKKILVYHNITPPQYFNGFSDELVRSLNQARNAVGPTARAATAVWANSEFNAKEIRALGIPDVKVLELPFTPSTVAIPPDPYIASRFAGQLKNILFVGRIAPNKRVEDLILAFAWYNQTINPYSRLLIVGSQRSAPRYYMMLRMLANELNLNNVCFEGFASPEGLSAYYDAADLFVCASEHEGYCLPLVEAMYKRVPVIARAAGGTPEAMDGAGILYDDLSHNELAGLMDRALSDDRLVGEVLASQDKRIERALARDMQDEVSKLLAGVLA